MQSKLASRIESKLERYIRSFKATIKEEEIEDNELEEYIRFKADKDYNPTSNFIDQIEIVSLIKTISIALTSKDGDKDIP